MLRYKFLTGDTNWQTYGGSFISNKLNNGDWDYWLVMEVINLGSIPDKGREYTEYNVSVSAVSPTAAGKEKLKEALKQCDMGDMGDMGDRELPEYFSTEIGKVEALFTYGIRATLFNENGNNLSKLMKKARERSQVISGLFGFFMDSPQNRIGSTGWDLIAGNLMAGLDRYREAKAKGEEVIHSPTWKIMDKISAR